MNQMSAFRKIFISIIKKRIRAGSGSDLGFLKRREMNKRVTDLRKIFLKTPFLIVGGVATRLYMPERMTLDLDVLISKECEIQAEEELLLAGCEKRGILSAGGSNWLLPDETNMDLLSFDYSWVAEAIASPVIASDNLPYIALEYFIIMKLHSSRAQDIADITRMLGSLEDPELAKIREKAGKYIPDDLEDIESLIALGRLEYSQKS